MTIATIPLTIADVGRQAIEHGEGTYPSFMKEFIDAVIRVVQAAGGPRDGVFPIPASMFSEAPPLLADPRLRAHLAGMAEHLATLADLPAPEWAEAPEFFLPEPFVMGGPRSRDHVVSSTPTAFSRRNFFCGPVLEKLHHLVEAGWFGPR